MSDSDKNCYELCESDCQDSYRRAREHEEETQSLREQLARKKRRTGSKIGDSMTYYCPICFTEYEGQQQCVECPYPNNLYIKQFPPSDEELAQLEREQAEFMARPIVDEPPRPTLVAGYDGPSND